MSKPSTEATTDIICLPLRKAAKLIQCSYDTLKRASDAGELKTFRLGRGTKKPKRFVKVTELENWLNRCEERGVSGDEYDGHE